jgi:hypothetical protein
MTSTYFNGLMKPRKITQRNANNKARFFSAKTMVISK